jgi:hypothetical protein
MAPLASSGRMVVQYIFPHLPQHDVVPGSLWQANSLVAELILPTQENAPDLIPNSTVIDIAAQIKANLQKAQDRMKIQVDKKRSERTLEVGDMVYLKIQPYRHTSLSSHRCLKLHSRYYGPFRVLAKVEKSSYKLLLPEGCLLHNIFHVSQLKKHMGPKAIPSPNLPLLNPDGTILISPEAILDRTLVPQKQGSICIQVHCWLIKWENMPVEQGTWEDAAFIQRVFPGFQP